LNGLAHDFDVFGGVGAGILGARCGGASPIDQHVKGGCVVAVAEDVGAQFNENDDGPVLEVRRSRIRYAGEYQRDGTLGRFGL
jgi:hypothetical protein